MPPFTAGVLVSTSVPTSPNSQVRTRFDDMAINTHNSSRDQPYNMPTSMMSNLHNIPAFTEHANPFTSFNTHSPSSSSVFGRSALPTLTIEFMMLFRQQVDESNHEMVNLLTQQISMMFNPLIQTTNQGYQALSTQMGRIANFFTPSTNCLSTDPSDSKYPSSPNYSTCANCRTYCSKTTTSALDSKYSTFLVSKKNYNLFSLYFSVKIIINDNIKSRISS